MSYSFTNPTGETLKDFIGVANPHAEATYSQILGQIERGEYNFSTRWLFAFEGVALAALMRAPVPRPIYRLRASPELTDVDTRALLGFAAALAKGRNLRRSTTIRQRLRILVRWRWQRVGRSRRTSKGSKPHWLSVTIYKPTPLRGRLRSRTC